MAASLGAKEEEMTIEGVVLAGLATAAFLLALRVLSFGKKLLKLGVIVAGVMVLLSLFACDTPTAPRGIVRTGRWFTLAGQTQSIGLVQYTIAADVTVNPDLTCDYNWSAVGTDAYMVPEHCRAELGNSVVRIYSDGHVYATDGDTIVHMNFTLYRRDEAFDTVTWGGLVLVR
jgi:hypothetical protein